MFLSQKSLSISVRDEHQEHPELSKTQGGNLCTSLTVWRKSLIVSCKGFTVIDSNGNRVNRVDTNTGRRPKELLLMDGSGKPIVARYSYIHSKNLRPVDTWLVYEGEVGELCTSEEPIFYVKKSINIFHAKPNVLAYVYRRSSEKRHAYTIEGSYWKRSCKVVDERDTVVAEIRPKDALNGYISFGLEVFMLIVQAGLDPGFAIALLLLLDQIFS